MKKTKKTKINKNKMTQTQIQIKKSMIGLIVMLQ